MTGEGFENPTDINDINHLIKNIKYFEWQITQDWGFIMKINDGEILTEESILNRGYKRGNVAP